MVARWERDEPAFVLGAMLPDFAQMCRARVGDISHDAIAAGVRCHHRADSIFHDTATFLALCSQARSDLRAAGVGRATALAAAHVGIELLLDGCWLDDPGVDAAYLAAIDHTVSLPPRTLAWSTDEHAERFAHLCRRLQEAGSPRAYGNPTVVGQRLERILAQRPRLAPSPSDGPRLVQWAHRVQPAVIAAAETLREEVREGLASAPP